MTVGQLAALLLRLPLQDATICIPPVEPEGEAGLDFADPHEVTGTSRWHGDFIGGPRHALIRGPYVRIDAMED